MVNLINHSINDVEFKGNAVVLHTDHTSVTISTNDKKGSLNFHVNMGMRLMKEKDDYEKLRKYIMGRKITDTLFDRSGYRFHIWTSNGYCLAIEDAQTTSGLKIE